MAAWSSPEEAPAQIEDPDRHPELTKTSDGTTHGMNRWTGFQQYREVQQLPLALQAGLWGLLGGSALVLGAAIAWFVTLPPRIVAAVMATGSGVLISAVAFDLMDEAYKQGGFDATAFGFLAGAAIYTAANIYISRRGAKHRKRSGSHPHERQQDNSEGSGLAIAVGALLDGIPESVVIGVSLLTGGAVSLVTVAAVFLSNVPEGLSSAAGMRKAGRSTAYIFGVWG